MSMIFQSRDQKEEEGKTDIVLMDDLTGGEM